METIRPLCLYLIRHGQSEDNVAGRFAGKHDAEPTSAGQTQMQATVRYFADKQLSAVYTSPAKRAYRMAAAMAASAQIPLYTLAELQERSFGQWEGLTFSEAQARYAPEMQAWLENPLTAFPPGGESLEQCIDRLTPVALWLKQAATSIVQQTSHTAHFWTTLPPYHIPAPTGAVAIVSHAAAIRVLLTLLLSAPAELVLRIACDHASISQIELFGQDHAVLRTLNCTAHLAQK